MKACCDGPLHAMFWNVFSRSVTSSSIALPHWRSASGSSGLSARDFLETAIAESADFSSVAMLHECGVLTPEHP